MGVHTAAFAPRAQRRPARRKSDAVWRLASVKPGTNRHLRHLWNLARYVKNIARYLRYNPSYFQSFLFFRILRKLVHISDTVATPKQYRDDTGRAKEIIVSKTNELIVLVDIEGKIYTTRHQQCVCVNGFRTQGYCWRDFCCLDVVSVSCRCRVYGISALSSSN